MGIKSIVSLITLVGVCTLCAASQSSVPETRSALPDALPLRLDDNVRDKNFYFLHFLNTSAATTTLRADTALGKLARSYRNRLLRTETVCGQVPSCYIDAARLSDSEIEAGKAALGSLYDRDSAVREAAEQLRRSGTMIRSQAETDQQLIGETWELSAV